MLYNEKEFLEVCKDLGIEVIKVSKPSMPLLNDEEITFEFLKELFSPNYPIESFNSFNTKPYSNSEKQKYDISETILTAA